MTDSQQQLQDVVLDCFRAAKHSGDNFGAWYYVVRQMDGFTRGQSWIIGRNGVRNHQWLDNANLDPVVTRGIDAFQRCLVETGQVPWRVLLMAGDDTGAFDTHLVYDDDPTVDEWDFDPVKGLNLVNKAMPILDIWPLPATPTEHVQTICTPFRDAARRTATKNFGTAYAVIDLTDPEHPVLRSQIRKANGTTADDWGDPDTTAIIAHHAAAYRRYHVDNDYPDWTQAAIAAKDSGPMLAKAIDTNPNLTNPDPTELIDHIIDTLNL